MSATPPVARQSIFNLHSPVMQAVSCIPGIGTISALFARVVLIVNMMDAKESNDAPKMIEILNLSKEYNKISIARNLLSAAFTAGAIALGILSGPTAIILVCAYLAFSMVSVCQIRHQDQQIDALLQGAIV